MLARALQWLRPLEPLLQLAFPPQLAQGVLRRVDLRVDLRQALRAFPLLARALQVLLALPESLQRVYPQSALREHRGRALPLELELPPPAQAQMAHQQVALE